ncbi:MAG: chemotaxis protein CheD [Solirubrobacteraceae bacterium]
MSAIPSEELVALGLGSCVGVAIVDRSAGVAGLAHVVLPESGGRRDELGKFADTAVAELVSRLRAAGAAPRRLEAVLAGGAHMFETSGLDIGSRNEQAVRDQLARARIPVRAAETGGSQGRTLRVTQGCTITVRVAGEEPQTLLDGGRSGGSGRAPGAASRIGTGAHGAVGHGPVTRAVCGGVGL